MSAKQWEIYAAYGGLGASDLAQIMGDRKLNPFTQAELLAAALAMPFKETGRGHYRLLIQDEQGRHPYEQGQIANGLAWLEQLRLEASLFDSFEWLPPYSFALGFRFELSRSYLSRDDDAFYIIDNPVRKDKVFKVPFVAPTSWKGCLRATTVQQLAEWWQSLKEEHRSERANRKQFVARRVQLTRLFGTEKGVRVDDLEERRFGAYLDDLGGGDLARWYRRTVRRFLSPTGFCAGRLHVYPTFFNRIGLEMINPHDRERRVGKNPILFECVPAGASGTFRLLYVPYDFPGEVTPDEAKLRQQVQTDLLLVAETVRDLLTVYGFGAKTSSGFGAADPHRVVGEFRVNCLSKEAASAGEPSESLVRRLLFDDPLQHQLEANFFVDGLFVIVPDDEIKQLPWGGKSKAAYRKVKPRVLELLAQQPTGPAHLSRPVMDLQSLPDVARELAKEIGGGA